MFKIEKYLSEKKETIKTIALTIAIPVAVVGVMALYGVNRLNGIIKENELHDLFYGDEKEEA